MNARSFMNVRFLHRLTGALVVAMTSVAPTASAQTDRRLTNAQSATVQLTLDDAVRRAVENNPDLAIVRLDTDADAARVGQSRSAYAPIFSTTFGRSSTATPPSNLFLGDQGINVGDLFSSTGFRQRLPWGSGTWSVSWDTARTTTNNPITSVDPNLASGIQFAFSQPLVKDRRVDESRYQYAIAKRNHDTSELQFRE